MATRGRARPAARGGDPGDRPRASTPPARAGGAASAGPRRRPSSGRAATGASRPRSCAWSTSLRPAAAATIWPTISGRSWPGSRTGRSSCGAARPPARRAARPGRGGRGAPHGRALHRRHRPARRGRRARADVGGRAGEHTRPARRGDGHLGRGRALRGAVRGGPARAQPRRRPLAGEPAAGWRGRRRRRMPRADLSIKLSALTPLLRAQAPERARAAQPRAPGAAAPGPRARAPTCRSTPSPTTPTRAGSSWRWRPWPRTSSATDRRPGSWFRPTCGRAARSSTTCSSGRRAMGRTSPLAIRLVKGAYWDAEAAQAAQHGWTPPVFARKAETDRNFEALTVRLIDARPAVRPLIASHNLRSIAHAVAVARRAGAETDVEFQVLRGLGDELAAALRPAACGCGSTARSVISWPGWPTWCGGCSRTRATTASSTRRPPGARSTTCCGRHDDWRRSPTSRSPSSGAPSVRAAYLAALDELDAPGPGALASLIAGEPVGAGRGDSRARPTRAIRSASSPSTPRPRPADAERAIGARRAAAGAWAGARRASGRRSSPGAAALMRADRAAPGGVDRPRVRQAVGRRRRRGGRGDRLPRVLRPRSGRPSLPDGS